MKKGLQVFAPQGLPIRWWSPSHPPELQSPTGTQGPMAGDIPEAPCAKQASRFIHGVSQELPLLFLPRDGSEMGIWRQGSPVLPHASRGNSYSAAVPKSWG